MATTEPPKPIYRPQGRPERTGRHPIDGTWGDTQDCGWSATSLCHSASDTTDPSDIVQEV